MDFKDLKLNRFGAKDANQTNDTKDAVYAGAYPTPKQIDMWRKLGQGNRSNEEDRGAPNVLTGTVITSCFLQTSALPSRVEIAGNDITFYDDTFTRNGEVIGDTSRIVWTHDLNSSEGFVMEKRASIFDTYDNVFAFYALPARGANLNYMFFGRQGRSSGNIPVLAETNAIQFNIDHKTGGVSALQSPSNGRFSVSASTDGIFTNNVLFGVFHNSILEVPGEGFSVQLSGTGTGAVYTNSNILPFDAVAGAVNIGAPGAKFGTFYGSVSACPLPTVDNALEMLDRIPEPVDVGERGHYGLEKKYFDDLTMPKELLHTDSQGHVDIEHNHMLGFLLKTVKELKAEIEVLKTRIDKKSS